LNIIFDIPSDIICVIDSNNLNKILWIDRHNIDKFYDIKNIYDKDKQTDQ